MATLSFQRHIVGGAGHDAWLSLLLVGLSLHLVVWFMVYVMREAGEGDVLSLHRQLFGRWLGSLVSSCFYGYAMLIIITQISSYVEVINLWVFPYTNPWSLCLFLVLTVVYLVAGGIRVIAGICFWCVVIPSFLLLTLYFPLKHGHWLNFLPMFNHDAGDYLISAKQSVPLFFGMEFFLLYYPFIKHKEKAHRWAQLGILHTTLVYMLIAVSSFAYFNQAQLKQVLWPTLTLSKIVSLPFLERFEYIYIFTWFFVIMPVCCLALWGGSRILRATVGVSVRYGLWLSAAIVFVCSILFRGPIEVDALQHWLNYASIGAMYGYIPLLALGVLIRKSLR